MHNILFFLLPDILVKSIGLLLLPIYTSYLLPEDYGIMSLGVLTGSIFTVIATLSLNSFIFKAWKNYDEPFSYIRTSYTLALIQSIFMIILFGIIYIVFNFEISSIIIYFVLLGLLDYFLFSYFLNIYRASNNAKDFFKISITKALLTMSTTVILLVFMKFGIYSIIIGQLIGIVIAYIFVAYKVTGNLITKDFKNVNLKLMYIYSTPFVFHFLSHMVLSSSDRYILGHFLGLSSVGIYSVGYQLATVLIVIYSGLNNILIANFTKYNDVAKLKDTSQFFVLLVLLIGISALGLCEDVISIFINEQYHEAKNFIQLLIVAHIFYGLYYIPLNILGLKVQKTKFIPVSMIIAGIVNIVLNYLLIPVYDINGAVYATIIAYFIMFVGILILAFNYERHNYYISKLQIIIVIPFGVLVYILNTFDKNIYQFIFNFIILASIVFLILYKFKHKLEIKNEP